MQSKINSLFKKRYYFGFSLPMQINDSLDIKRSELIQMYNKILKEEVIRRGDYFVDVFSLTSTKDNRNNNLYMCDNTHLSPEYLNKLIENHLSEPKD